jgi:hypothetical protein
MFDLLSRWYWDFIYKANKYLSLLLFIVFGFLTFVSLQYWEQVTRPITRGYSETVVGDVQVLMWTPDKLYIGEDYQSKVEFELDYDAKQVEEDVNISVQWEIVDKNLAFAKNPLVFKLNTADGEKRSTKLYYRRSSFVNQTTEIKANITIGDETKTVTRSVVIAKAPNEIFAAAATVIAAISTMLSLIDQIKKLFTKKE